MVFPALTVADDSRPGGCPEGPPCPTTGPNPTEVVVGENLTKCQKRATEKGLLADERKKFIAECMKKK
jgi:hypothetical protein